MILGITGTLGSGKGSVVEYLVKKRGFVHYSSSDLLKELLIEKGEIVDRDNLAKLAREIRAVDPRGVPMRTYEQLKKDNPENAILEALHTIGEVEFVRSVGGVILGIDADVAIRYERIQKRRSVKDGVSYEKFVEQTKREEMGESDATGHNIRGAIDVADYTIENNGTLEELHKQIEAVLEKIEEG